MGMFQRKFLVGLTSVAALSVLPVGAASAQEAAVGACGQPAALNGAPITLNTVPTDLVGGMLQLQRNEPRYIELTLGEKMPLTLSTVASNDTTLALFDSKGEIVASDDDSGEESNAQIIAVLEPGTYCAQVDSYDGLSNPSAMVPLAINAAPSPDACIRKAAEPVELGLDSEELVTTGGLLGEVNLAVKLAPATRVTVAARSPMFDTYLTVQDEYGQQVAYDDDGGGDTNSLLELEGSEEGGTYCITLTGLEDGKGIYSLAVSPAIANPMTPEAQQQFEAEQAAETAAAAAAAATEAAAAAGEAMEGAAQGAAAAPGTTEAAPAQ